MAETQTNETAEELPAELEGQFILRLPPDIAAEIKTRTVSETSNLQKRLRIELDDDRRCASIKYDDKIFPAKIYDLPAIIECHKTFDKKMFYKIADICQIMICGEDQMVEENEKPYLFHEYTDKEGRDKRYLYPHGITPCLKNVRKNRFRKTRKNRCAETPFVQKEVLRLLKTDSEATDYRFELVDPEDEKKSSEAGASKNSSENKTPGEFDIFGAILSSSEDSDDENNETVNSFVMDMNKSIEEDFTQDDSDDHVFSDNINRQNNNPEYPIEAEVAGMNLGEMLKDHKTESEKEELLEMLKKLDHEIAEIRAQKRSQEIELLNIRNPALKLRYEMNIEHLTTKELEMQREYNQITNSLD